MAIESSVGFRVFTKIERPSAQTLKLFEGVESTHVSDAMHRFGGMDLNILPVSAEMRAVGPAITVRSRPGDFLMVLKAMEIASRGDIIVIEHRGYTTVSSWGDMMSATAKALGLGAVVTDGGVRDAEGIKRVGFPVFARNWQSPLGGFRDGPGEVNVPISCGGVAVLPGDVVIGDANGVTIVPRDHAEEVGRKAIEILRAEQDRMKEIERGSLIPAWLDKTLKEKGCLIV